MDAEFRGGPRIRVTSLAAFGWALIVVGGLVGLAGASLVFVGQRIVSDPDRIVQTLAVVPKPVLPVLNPKQDRLLRRVWEIQSQFALDYLVIAMNGRVHFDDKSLQDAHHFDLKVEILRGEPVPADTTTDPAFEDLVDGMPEAYLRRLDRADPNRYLRFGRNAVVSVTEAGVTYVRGK